MDQAAVVELLVAGVAAIGIGGAGAEGIGAGVAEILPGGRIAPFAPGIEGLVFLDGSNEVTAAGTLGAGVE